MMPLETANVKGASGRRLSGPVRHDAETGQLGPDSTVLADKGRQPVDLSESDEESTT